LGERKERREGKERGEWEREKGMERGCRKGGKWEKGGDS